MPQLAKEWRGVPIQFRYPWGWSLTPLKFRQGRRPRYTRRRLTAFQRTQLDRITSAKKPDTTVHPDQLYLF